MGKKLNLIGQKFGKLLVIQELDEKTKAGKTRFRCLCDCGNYHDVVGSSLKSGLVKTCGHCKSSVSIGSKFSKLTVVEDTHDTRPNGAKIYKCVCACGTITYVDVYSLQSGNTKSCGCLSNPYGSVATSNKRLYHCWTDMKRRCYDTNGKNYPEYGKRGIKVCDEWYNDFIAFHNWAINNGYDDNLTIDRIDVNGNYEPNNCRWATIKQQANNKRTTINITIGDITKSLKQWCRDLNLNYSMIYARYRKGVNIQAFFMEVLDESTIDTRADK